MDLLGSKNIPKELTIDTSLMLAKLHLSGKTLVSIADASIVNTGIVNDNDNDPSKPGNISFDLKSKNGEYELGVVIDVEYNGDDTYAEGIKKQLDELLANEDVTISEEDLKKKLQEFYSKENPDDKNPIDQKLTVDQIKDQIKKILLRKNLSDKYKENFLYLRKMALRCISEYMKQFAGDKYKPCTEEELVAVAVPEGFSGKDTKNMVKDYVIKGFDDATLAKEESQNEDSTGSRTICFKVKYKLTSES